METLHFLSQALISTTEALTLSIMNYETIIKISRPITGINASNQFWNSPTNSLDAIEGRQKRSVTTVVTT